LDSYIHRFEKNQPIVCPSDITRYFVSPKEAGTLCLLACLLGESGDIFIPKLTPEKDLIPFEKTILAFFDELGIPIDYCGSENEARERARRLDRSKPVSYPVYLFKTDTSGEKSYEEFFTENDLLDWKTFRNMGIIKQQGNAGPAVESLLLDANRLFESKITKQAIVRFLTDHVAGFCYDDKGKSLDQKM
jgi:FlaA1/EpsC-like NDP-sugar epimerase